ncbi:MAG: 3-hydroxyacyl-CoA dehydrogenase NAD-binding domain-containing protein [Planctomycetota bacterium]|nr:3-hydroxyacyl-CoA dehydrogenase NAD-binding domain-containing protein [Planctomycetota bacterium]
MISAFHSESMPDGIERVTFDLPDRSANILTRDAMDELRRLVTDWRRRSDIRALILQSAKDGIWIAGADIDQFQAIGSSEDGERLSRMGQAIFNDFADLPFPTIAAIDGACLGGGLELALACRYRIASRSEKTKLGLPEVLLGIVPALGGTQRLPRLIGLRAALDLILTGRRIGAGKALRKGLVDETYSETIFDEWSLRFARGVMGDAKPRRRRRWREWLLETNPIARTIIISIARKRVLEKTGGKYPAAPAALECIGAGLGAGIEEGLLREASSFGKLAVSAESRNLVRIFRWQESARKGESGETKPLRSAGVLGAGTMGGGIAWLLSRRGIAVRLRDTSAGALRAGLKSAWKIHEGSIRRGRETQAQAEDAMGLISPTLDLTGFRNAGIVIEAVVEDLQVKREVLAGVESAAMGGPIFATNTSAIPLSSLIEGARWPERVVGMHFFNPVHAMPLVEVIRGEKTDPVVVETVVALARRLGKTPIVVKDTPGFLVNRILGPYIREACLLLEEGYEIGQVDAAMKEFGMPMGPLRLIDEVGIIVAAKVADNLDGGAIPAVLQALVKDGRLGRKGGEGFYHYSKGLARIPWMGPRERPDETVRNLPGIPRRPMGDPVDIVARLVLPMVSEAAACLEEAIAAKASDVDLASVLGFGFAPFRGGVLSYADHLGLELVLSNLEALASRFGERLKPHPGLVERAKDGREFHDD